MDDDLREHLMRRETALARRNPAGIEGGLGGLIAEDFVEFGASGRVWDPKSIEQVLAAPPAEIAIEGFEIAELAPDVVLATYRTGAPRPANRSSIWVRRAGRWVLRFHQGTPRLDDRRPNECDRGTGYTFGRE